MARYIDADALIEDIQETICAKCGDISDGIKCKSCGIDDTLDFLGNAPTADVVPKSEVAREIFAEMLEKLNHIVITADADVEYNTFMKTINQVCSAVSAELAELKKKYTEENDG